MTLNTNSSARELTVVYSCLFQTVDDPPTQFTYRVDGTGVFSINADGFVVLNVDDLDYETTQQITFKVGIVVLVVYHVVRVIH